MLPVLRWDYNDKDDDGGGGGGDDAYADKSYNNDRHCRMNNFRDL